MTLDALTQGEFVKKFEHLKDRLGMSISPSGISPSHPKVLDSDKPDHWMIFLRGGEKKSHYVSMVYNVNSRSNTTGNVTYKIEQEDSIHPVPQQNLDLLEGVYAANGWQKIDSTIVSAEVKFIE